MQHRQPFQVSHVSGRQRHVYKLHGTIGQPLALVQAFDRFFAHAQFAFSGPSPLRVVNKFAGPAGLIE